ncbi:MAG: hypothetical protein JKX72_02310 [Robiginitomaculum sp.]|nr:hypothetical protein [Robiginitomaculum sp.]
MHIIGIVIALATAVFWVGRAARSAKDIADMASTLKNMKRPNRFKTRSAKRDLSSIDEPMDAAVILMICVARLSSFGQMGEAQISDGAHAKITELLVGYMQVSKSEAGELLTQMLWTTSKATEPETILSPMTNIISKQINHKDASDLSTMLGDVANIDGIANSDQTVFITRFENRMGVTSP